MAPTTSLMGRRGIDNRTLGYIFFRGMQTKYQIFRLSIPTPVIRSTISQSLLECFSIDAQDKHLVEHVEEFGEVPRATTEERDLIFFMGCYLPDLIDVPNMMLMTRNVLFLFAIGVILPMESPGRLERATSAHIRRNFGAGLQRALVYCHRAPPLSGSVCPSIPVLAEHLTKLLRAHAIGLRQRRVAAGHGFGSGSQLSSPTLLRAVVVEHHQRRSTARSPGSEVRAVPPLHHRLPPAEVHHLDPLR